MKWLVIIMITAFLPAIAVGMNPTLTVVGEGTVTVPADTATVSLSVESNRENMTEAQTEVQGKLSRAIDALKRAGVKDEEIMPGQASGVTSFQSSSRICKRVNNSTICENNSEQASSLVRSAIVLLKTTDESRIKSVLDAAESAGAEGYVAGYGLSDASEAVSQARQKAVENARANAEGMAAAEGVRLGKAVDISDYGYPIGLNDYIGSSAKPGMVDLTFYVIVTYEFDA